MTGIDTRVAEKHWKEHGKDSIDFLKTIGFVGFDKTLGYIYLTTDEEGNNEIILNKKSALWLSKELKKLSKEFKDGE